jgi:hypothetical protein
MLVVQEGGRGGFSAQFWVYLTFHAPLQLPEIDKRPACDQLAHSHRRCSHIITPAKMTKNTTNSKSEKEASASVSRET